MKTGAFINSSDNNEFQFEELPPDIRFAQGG
jgi:hypothetical protein